jgi:uncharacterized protein
VVTSYRFIPANKRSGVPQADELVRAARVPVFLLDEYQGVRPYEVGTVERIEEVCARNDTVVRRVDRRRDRSWDAVQR